MGKKLESMVEIINLMTRGNQDALEKANIILGNIKDNKNAEDIFAAWVQMIFSVLCDYDPIKEEWGSQFVMQTSDCEETLDVFIQKLTMIQKVRGLTFEMEKKWFEGKESIACWGKILNTHLESLRLCVCVFPTGGSTYEYSILTNEEKDKVIYLSSQIFEEKSKRIFEMGE